MKNYTNLTFFGLLILLVFVVSCTNVPSRKLPIRNVDNFRVVRDSINTFKDELAPYQRVKAKNCIESYYRENSITNNDNLEISPSYKFFSDLMGKDFENNYESVIQNLTNKLEAVSYLTSNAGFVALSHPTDSNYNFALNLPFWGSVGGTDLFYFEFVNSKPVFTALPNEINSDFWDSHPFSAVDSFCNKLLIWSSDRNSPYSKTVDLQNKTLIKGHTDLFYSFYKNGKWSNAKTFEFQSKINTENFNEISPFVACLNISPKLFFSSNRNGDYDIFVSDIAIDYVQEIMTVKSEPILLPKGKETDIDSIYINTYSNEFFPYISIPYNNTEIKSLFLSSNRNTQATQLKKSKDTVIINKGNYDIYSFNYELECTPEPPPPPPPAPIAKINVSVIDMEIPNRIIQKPIIKLVDVQSEVEIISNSESNSFDVELGKTYDVFGGSNQNSLFCEEEGDSLLQYYQARKITKLLPIIKKREIITKYDSVENAKLIVKYDTNIVKELYPITEMNRVQPAIDFKTTSNNITETRNEIIKDVSYKPCVVPCDTIFKKKNIQIDKNISDTLKFIKENTFIEVTKQVITKKEWFEGGKIVQKSYKTIVYDTTQVFDTTFISAVGAVAKSELTHFGRIYINSELKHSVYINDTIYLKPVYYVKPPCSCNFTDIEHSYNKNVPYFQTAFWKVNTTDGYIQHLNDFQKGNYLESAGYIELHPKHRFYGVGNSEARERRKKMYQDYAVSVDRNLLVMRDEIVNRFIPALESLDSLTSGTKILIKIEAYSDERKADKCNYIGTTIEYMQGKKDKDGKISLIKEKLSNGASLSYDNENLSKLRVFYGFNELFKRLKNNAKFNSYLNKGLVFYPTQNFENEEEMYKAIEKARIIILAEGKYYDKVFRDDIEDYDPVRRINLYIDLIKINNKYVEKTPCCNPKINCGE